MLCDERLRHHTASRRPDPDSNSPFSWRELREASGAPLAQPATKTVDVHARFEREVDTHLRWNFVTNMVYGLFGTTGWRLVFTPTFIPAYAFAITQSEFLVGFLGFLTGALRMLSPFAATSIVEHRHRAKPVALAVGTGMRLQLAVIALSAILLHETWPSLNIAIFFIAMPLCHGLGGMQGVAYGMVMSKVIPATGRGLWNRNLFIGFRNSLGGVTAILLILGVREHFQALPFPNDFAYLLLFGFGLTCLGLAFFAFSREPDSPIVAARESVLEKVYQIPATLRANPNFARFVLARALASFAFLALPFYILHAREVLSELPGVEVSMTLYWMAASSLLDPIWGFIAYRRGFRLVFLLAIGLWVAGSLVFVWGDTEAAIAAAFAAIAAANGGFQISSFNMVLEFSDSDLRPRLIATNSTIGDVSMTVSALVGGYLAEVAPLPVLFLIACAFLAASGYVMARHVREPRSPSIDEALGAETPGLHDRPVAPGA